jgi:GT2 family glycosyltransferase
MKTIAVVLLNYNGIALLKQFLPKVVEYSPEASIYLIDNKSNDASVAWVKENHPSIQCIELNQNLGYAGGYNEGLKQIEAEIYCLLNTDVLVTSNWLPPLLDHFKSHPKTAILQPHILDFKKPSHFEYAGAAGGFIDKNGVPYCRGRLFSTLEEDLGQYDAPTPIFWASGACFFIRREQFWELNGFDAEFFAHQEEIDLCWRIHNQGYKTMAIGKVKVYHVGGATLAPSPRKTFLNHRNSLWMLTKNLPKNELYLRLFVRMCWDGLAGIYYFLGFNFSSTWAIIKAHLAFYNGFNSMLKKRNAKTQDADYFQVKNVVLKYFLYKKLNFKDLNKE